MQDSKFNSENYNEYRDYLCRIASDNSREFSIIKRNLLRAILEELTEKEWASMRLYYVDGVNMTEIASLLGRNKSTVSRNIRRGREKLKRCLRYGAKELLRESLSSSERPVA